MNIHIIPILTTLLLAVPVFAWNLDDYNVIWNTSGINSHDSMPLGNGDVGVNAWVEASGDLVFYISKTDAWDENGRLCKIGRVRVKLDPALPVTESFRQELKLREGTISINAGKVRLELWVDANWPVVQLNVESDTPIGCRAEVELWRCNERPWEKDEDGHSGYGLASTVLPDVVVKANEPPVVWYHQNTKSLYPVCLKTQHLETLADRYPDPLLNLSFGGRLTGNQFIRDGEQAIKSEVQSKRHKLEVSVLTTKGEFLAEVERIKPLTNREAHEQWWRNFWERSWIFVDFKQPLVLPITRSPWTFGIASNCAHRFSGDIVGAQVHAGTHVGMASLDSAQAAVQFPPADVHYENGLTVEAWIKPSADGTGTIIEKLGNSDRSDWMVFEVRPSLSLQWKVGGFTLIAPACLKAGEWQHVAATTDENGVVRRIYLNGKLVKEECAPPDKLLTRGYVLQRFMNACSGRGVSPIKFNGSIFTVEKRPGASPETVDGNPDWRNWGGCYWFQNTRLSYWPMLKAGDFDFMDAWFRMYRDALPLNRDRIKTYYNFENAAQFPETMYWWGLPGNCDYGWKNTAPEPANSYIRRYWNGSLELIAIMLDRYEFTNDQAFLRDTLLPLADPLISFLDQYWQKRDADGKKLFDPAQSLETFHVAVNPLPEIAGLRFILPRLLKLAATSEQRARWSRLLDELPPLPIKDGLLQPAESFSMKKNLENPQLYAVFPYRLYGVGRPDLEMAQATFKARANRHGRGWCQDSIQAACLGLGEEAGRLVTARAAQTTLGYRFPAMWGPNSDWVPDQDHGNNILTTLQFMLLQSDGDTIRLLPAWPKDWNADFKLHAPQNTTLEGRVENGTVTRLIVTPLARRGHVIVQQPFTLPSE